VSVNNVKRKTLSLLLQVIFPELYHLWRPRVDAPPR